MNSISYIDIFFSPTRVFNKKLKKSNALASFAMISFLTVVISVCTILTLGDNAILKEKEHLRTIAILFAVIMGLFTPLMGILVIAIINYIVLIVINIHFDFRKLMIIGAYSYMPLLVDSLLKFILSLYLEGEINYSPTSFAMFISDKNTFLFSFINNINGCVIWSICIYIIGLLVLAKESNITKTRKIIASIICVNIILIILTSFISTATI